MSLFFFKQLRVLKASSQFFFIFFCSNPCCIYNFRNFAAEKCRSGRTGLTRNQLYPLCGTGGSNPSFSAKRNHYGFFFFAPKTRVINSNTSRKLHVLKFHFRSVIHDQYFYKLNNFSFLFCWVQSLQGMARNLIPV